MRRPLRIAQIGHPILRQPTRILTHEELLSEEIQSFLDDLVETMREANGAGLAANQVYPVSYTHLTLPTILLV